VTVPSPRYWREIPTRYRLEAGRCRGCGKVAVPKRRICPECRGTDWEPTTLSWKGKVITSTVVQVAPTEFATEAPYAVAVIETPEGARLMTQVVDCDPAEVQPGMDVSLVFRRIREEGQGGILCYGYKAVPVA
jgi:uncharacterized OB-fold protein